jgi:hypothetical protein
MNERTSLVFNTNDGSGNLHLFSSARIGQGNMLQYLAAASPSQ